MHSLQEQHNVLEALSQWSCWPLKSQALGLFAAKTHETRPFPLSKPFATGIHFPSVLPCVLVCLSPCSATVAPSPLRWPRSVSLPNCVSTLSTFFSVASSLGLVVEFVLPVLRSIVGCIGWFDSYVVVFVGQGEPKALLLCCYLPALI